MSTPRAARAVVACAAIVALGAITPARAERRPVAVIDLTLGDDPRATDVAKLLQDDLGTHPALRRLQSVAYESALIEPPPDDDAQRIGSATTNLKNAERYLAEYNASSAKASAETGLSGLPEVAPREAAPLFAQLAFVRGQAELALKHPDEAATWFSLVHAITPQRILDPDQYFPEVIKVFADATPSPARSVNLEVRGTGEVWIDGASYGAAPREAQVAPGRHVVQLTGVDRETRGDFAIAKAGERLRVEIPDAIAPVELQIRRARQALAHANDTVERASSMGRLAALIEVGDAILLSTRDGKLMVQTWRNQAPGFSRVDERGARTAAELLAALAPPPLPKQPPPPPILFPIEQPRWYQHRTVQLGVGLGVVAIVVSSILWATYTPGMQPANIKVTAQ
ncbi:MAG: hypothetical protein NT062_38430 [Proteobacteria bacterium]|nr:hypothetical protein [Pseudomonadota bacterium]